MTSERQSIPADRPYRGTVFYGWWMVVIGALAQGVGGGQAYITGLVIVSLRSKLNGSAEEYLLATIGAQMAGYGLMAPLYGYLIRRFSLRFILALMFGLAAAGYLAMTQVSTIRQLALVYGVLFSLAYYGYVAGQTIVAQWFERKRGLAMGVAACGNVIPGFLVLPILTFMTSRYGLAAACLCYALALLLLIPIALKWVVDWPEQRGTHPDGIQSAAPQPQACAPEKGTEWTYRRMLRSSKFFVVAAIVTILQATIIQVVTNLMPILHLAGLGLQQAALLVSILSVTALAGKLGMGWLSDKLSTPIIVLAPVVFLATGCLLLIGNANLIRYTCASVCAGLGGGMINVAFGIVIGRVFDRGSFASIAAGTVPIFVILMGAMMWGIGRSADITADYDFAMIGLAVLLAVPAALVFRLNSLPILHDRLPAESG